MSIIICTLVASAAAFGMGALIGYTMGFSSGEDSEASRRERVAAEQARIKAKAI
jgi:hypothetical protein